MDHKTVFLWSLVVHHKGPQENFLWFLVEFFQGHPHIKSFCQVAFPSAILIYAWSRWHTLDKNIQSTTLGNASPLTLMQLQHRSLHPWSCQPESITVNAKTQQICPTWWYILVYCIVYMSACKCVKRPHIFQCIVQSYLRWLEDSDCDPKCQLCKEDLKDHPCVRLTCYRKYIKYKNLVFTVLMLSVSAGCNVVSMLEETLL